MFLTASRVLQNKKPANTACSPTALRAENPTESYWIVIASFDSAASGKIISRANVKASSKNALLNATMAILPASAKLLAKQKTSKKRMKMVRKMEVPQEAHEDGQEDGSAARSVYGDSEGR
jgi:translation elongation factor EF-4